MPGQTNMDNILDRIKVLIDSSTPMHVMETVEEMRAVRLVRAASAGLSLATFERSIANSRPSWRATHSRLRPLQM